MTPAAGTHRLALGDEALQHVGQGAGLGRVEGLAGAAPQHQLHGGAPVLGRRADLVKSAEPSSDMGSAR